MDNTKYSVVHQKESDEENGARQNVDGDEGSRDEGEDVALENDPHGERLLDENSTSMDQIKVLVQQAIPVVLSFFLTVGGGFINMVFAGHFTLNGNSTAVFAGVSLASMFMNVTSMSLLVGMSAAVETLGSQHNGAGNYREVGIIFQRCCWILLVISIPVVFVWIYTKDIFLAIGVEDDVCQVISTFVSIRSLTLPMDIVNESYEKYLMSIGVMNPSMWANIVFNLSILLFDYIFVYIFHFGYQSLAWAWVISVYLSALAQYFLSLPYEEVKRTLQPFSMESFTKWMEFINLGIPSTVMMCSEWWAYELLTMFASFLGTEEIAAQTIILQTATLAFMIPLGIAIASASLVGNAIGAGFRTLATRISNLAILLIISLELFIGLSIVLFGENFIRLFTNDEKVVHIACSTLLFLSFFTFGDGIQGVGSGILRGAGRQSVGAVTNVIAFYVLGLPIAYFLCFRYGMGVRGLMMGMSFGTAFQVSVLLYLIYLRQDYVFNTELIVKHESKDDIELTEA